MESRANAPKVAIVLARCRHGHGTYGIRFEQREPSVWYANWAFKMPERTARNEGYDKTDIKGSFDFDEEYPGCPYCQAQNIFKCNPCGKTSCWDGTTKKVTCPGCNRTIRITDTIGSLSAGSDR